MSFTPKDFTVWMEIPVTNLAKSKTFYEAITGGHLDTQTMGSNETAMFRVTDLQTGVAGHLYEGKPANDGSGPTIHLAIEDTLEAAMDRVRENGGEVVSDPIEIPSGRFFYLKDLDGNSVGLFEAAA